MSGTIMGSQMDLREREDLVLGQLVGRRLRPSARLDAQVSLEADAVVPTVGLAQGNQVGSAVESIGHQADLGLGRQPRKRRSEQVLLDLEADGPLRRNDASSHRQCPLADAQCQHQHLVALVDLGLIQEEPAARPARPSKPCVPSQRVR